jgi:hypothetical protein
VTAAPTRLLLGALAGLTATAAMTSVMNRLHARLPARERYPLPPREITAIVTGQPPERPRGATADLALAAHFAFGGAVGALGALLRTPAGPMAGALGGLAVWAVSYFGWVPLFGILRPAATHPPRRTALMIAAHLVWGVTAAVVLDELWRAREGMLAPGPARDA